MGVHELAGKAAPAELLPDIPEIVSAYFNIKPDHRNAAQRVSFGTSGHRGTSLNGSFNQNHIIAISQAICAYRKRKKIKGPLFVGMDTHALSRPALETAVRVFAANGVNVMVQEGMGYTPTPVISHAILTYNQNKSESHEMADGVVITPSHNPPQDGGFKYNMTHGGPADSETTKEIENLANKMLESDLKDCRRMDLADAQKSGLFHFYDYVSPYVRELGKVVNMDAIRSAGVKIGVDPMGGAGIRFWEPIAEKYKLDLTLVNNRVDPTFSFMRVDKDGKIRMDCSSAYAMAGLIDLKDKFDISFGNDPDYDRHGIVTKSRGLLNPNHYLSVAIWYLYQNRPDWPKNAKIGKTLVSSSMIDRVAKSIKREVSEVPVGFKWFVDGLFSGEYAFGGEESAGASFLRMNGKPWSTDKDGIILNLLSAEILAVTGKDPGDIYGEFEEQFGSPVYDRMDAPATKDQKAKLAKLDANDVTSDTLAGDKITGKLTKAPGNNAEIGGLKVVTENGWFAARPSGTEDIYKIYTESFKGEEHLREIQKEAREIVDSLF